MLKFTENPQVIYEQGSTIILSDVVLTAMEGDIIWDREGERRLFRSELVRDAAANFKNLEWTQGEPMIIAL